jgi:DNA-binding SARP family transcriptional activator/pimeloyl-ACP methyl ester carboxylesterase
VTGNEASLTAGTTASAVPPQVRLIGEFAVVLGDRKVSRWPRKDAAALVKVLALTPSRSLHRERVLDILWPDLDPVDGAPRLHKAAHFARQALGERDAIVLRGDSVALFPGVHVVVDIEQFDGAFTAAAGGTAEDADAVLNAFPGEVMPADLYEPWAQEVRERHHANRLRLLRQARRWEELLEIEPAHEEAHLELTRRYVREGDRSGALRQFERMDRALRDELGVGPGPAAVELRKQLVSVIRDLGPLTVAEEARVEQRIQFCRTPDDVTIAYATTGSGFPLVKAANWLTHLDHDWHSPVWRHWLVDLSRRHRLIRYDERGCGLSDLDLDPAAQSVEAWIRDLETVVDAAGLDRFDLLGISQGGPVAVEYADRHPERVRRIVLYGTYPQGRLVRATSEDEVRSHRLQVELARHGWGRDDPAFRMYFTSSFMPGASKEIWDAFNDLQRLTTSPENAAMVLDLCADMDVTETAKRVQAPSMVLHARDDRRAPFQQGRLFASLLPDCRFVALDSSNHILLAEEPAWQVFLREVDSFLAPP